MDVSQSLGDTLVRKARKKRLPKACGACRNSKARCDGQSPCSRCRHLRKECLFEKTPKDERDSRIEYLESEVDDLKSKLHAAAVASQSSHSSHPGIALREEGAGWPRIEQLSTTPSLRPSDAMETLSNAPTSISPASFVGSLAAPRLSPQVNPQCPECHPSKKRRSHFETKLNTPSDVLTMGLISPTEAETYFQTFFQGCHQYVPVLNDVDDSMEQIRARSGILFSVICASGCRILKGTDSQAWRSLNFHVRRLLNIAVGSPSIVSLETIQALLIRAAYVSERSFLTTLATRFAIELGIPESFDDLISRCISPSETVHSSLTDDDKVLARKSRTWLHIINMGHILHVDASDVLLFKMRGSSRRCRVLLQGTLKADLDLHLISQVELNVLRAETYAALSTKEGMSEEEILAIVREARIDTNVWFNDWLLIFSQASSRSQQERLAQNLEIQKCWAETMTLCRAIRLSGVDNVDAMSDLQREMLAMAKEALAKHLDIIIQEPRLYLQNLRYAMDFVWAKCAFCFLLLLKLSILLPDNREETGRELLQHGRTLIRELRDAADVKGTAGQNMSGNYNSTRHVYLQILQSGLENFSRTVLGVRLSSTGDAATGTSTPRQRFEGAASANDQNELDSVVLEQFVFEWDFPGLTLFSSPITEAGWLDDFLSNAIMGDEDFYNFGYVPS